MSIQRVGDLERRLANVAKVGKVVQADYAAGRVQVAIGRNQTAWIPWISQRAGNDKTWHAPEVGEQVIVLSPSGDFSQGIVLGGGVFYNGSTAPFSSADKSGTIFSDGASVQYDRAAHAYQITVPAGGKATVKTGANAQLVVEDSDVTMSFGSNGSIVLNSSGLTMTFGTTSITLTSSGIATKGDITQTGKITSSGDVTTSGKVSATGNITTSGGDVTAGTVTLKTHTHPVPGVAAGTTTVNTGVGVL